MVGSRVELLVQALEQEIIIGTLPPGARLDESSLANRFGVSRTPVREALNQLASNGLIELRPRRGAIVAAPDLKDLLDMFEVMAELEAMCGRLAARRMSETECAVLQKAHDGSEVFVVAGDADQYYRANVAFHEAIYNGCHNRFLANQTRALRNRLAPFRRLQLHRVDRIRESFAEHATVLQAIRARDVAKTDQLLRSHVTVQGGSFTDFIAALPSGRSARA